ncbi:protein SpAN-like [Hydractinia symbiolongicarpus]|uniref:protein SpAN-like n=1 Tax=Hydractinia symbiolongicarpus TaxID=13093 RepID=UPI00254F4A15|nr:protein SpAN-like [Hydractinia symbiolongicarpus]
MCNTLKGYRNEVVLPYIFFPRSGCWSYAGRVESEDKVPGQQILHADEGCEHEQSRPDRDKYVTVMERNIMDDQEVQLEPKSKEDVDSMGYAYDFESITHYGKYFFSRNGRKTIKPKRKYRKFAKKMGQRSYLSLIDLAQMRAMYKCNKIPSVESKKMCVSKKTKGRDYRGKLDYTEHGVMCQSWNHQYPHSHNYTCKKKREGLGRHNYCRNPFGQKERPWCFTTLTGTAPVCQTFSSIPLKASDISNYSKLPLNTRDRIMPMLGQKCDDHFPANAR